MFSLGAIATISATALLLCQRTLAFVVSPTASVRSGWGSSPLPSSSAASAAAAAALTRMSCAPKNVQDVWDNHFAAFGGKDVSDTTTQQQYRYLYHPIYSSTYVLRRENLRSKFWFRGFAYCMIPGVSYMCVRVRVCTSFICCSSNIVEQHFSKVYVLSVLFCVQ